MRQEVIQKAPEQTKKPMPNMTGIPTQMKLDFERRSGLSFDDVRVHYNSDKPRKIGALAYTQIPQVHIGPGQERHLRHELGHVVQQKQGIVRPTTWINGLPVNDSPGLERSASQSMFSVLPLVKSDSVDNTHNAVQMIAINKPIVPISFDDSGNIIDNEQRYLIKDISVETSALGRPLTEEGRPVEETKPSGSGKSEELKESAASETRLEKGADDGLHTLSLSCEALGSSPSGNSVRNGNAKELFGLIEIWFQNQFLWIEKYYEATTSLLRDSRLGLGERLARTDHRASRLLRLLKAAITSGSNLGEDAYTLFKNRTTAGTLLSELYFPDLNKSNLILSLNKARICTGLLQKNVMSNIANEGTHEDSSLYYDVIVPETTLTSQSYAPCIAMIVVSGQRPIVCLNSGVFLRRLRSRRSFKIGMLPKYISPAIGRQLRALTTDKLGEYPYTLGAGTHAEVRAVNKYFKAYGQAAAHGTSDIPVDLRIVKVQDSDCLVRGSTESIREFPKCKHCAAILNAAQLGVHWAPNTVNLNSVVSAKTTGIAVSAKESIQDAVRELGFEIVDRRQPATPPGPAPGPGSGTKRPL